jgi:hypothetical protein
MTHITLLAANKSLNVELLLLLLSVKNPTKNGSHQSFHLQHLPRLWNPKFDRDDDDDEDDDADDNLTASINIKLR